MSIRAKFSCKEIKHNGKEYDVIFEPVYSGSEENRVFFSYTPSGQIRLGVVSPSTAEQFKIGHDYYVDFTDVEEL